MGYVTDHAVLRYLERHCGVDVEAVRAHLTVKGIDTAAEIGCDTVILGDGVGLTLVGNTAVTWLGPRHTRKQKRAVRHAE